MSRSLAACLALALTACAQPPAGPAAVALAAAPAQAPLHAAATAGAAQSAAKRLTGPGISGDVRVHLGFASKLLPRKRDVFVYLPPGYDAATATRYPVLYAHDGNNMFDPAQAFMGNEWHADESMERLLAAREVPPMIVVGVGNTPDRLDEYTWTKGDLDGQPAGGNGEAYGRFLTTELKPFIDRSYRTRPGRGDTGVMGSSLGGLQSFYLGRHLGQVFGKIGVMSPSIWWADRAVLNEVGQTPTDLKIWLDMGHHEGSEEAQTLANARELAKRLHARGYQEGRDMRFYEDLEGGHNERAWAYRFPIAVKFLYGGGAGR